MWQRSPQRFFPSVLYFHVVDCGAVFVDGIDKQENGDELRISNLEKHSEVGSSHTTDHKDEMKTPESK